MWHGGSLGSLARFQRSCTDSEETPGHPGEKRTDFEVNHGNRRDAASSSRATSGLRSSALSIRFFRAHA
jgi:hypothetical protein